MSQELQDYIAQAQQKGFSDKDIYDQLVEAGWEKGIITKNLGLSTPTKSSSTKKTNRNILIPVTVRFVAIVIIITLYAVSWLFYGVLGGQSKPPIINLNSIVFVFVPVGLITISIISLLTGQESGYSIMPTNSQQKKSSSGLGKIIKVSLTLYAIWLLIGLLSYLAIWLNIK